MMIFVAAGLLAIGCAVALYNWRWGVYAVVLAGFLQDPLRKLLPGEPVYMTLYAAVIFGFCVAGALVSNETLNFEEITRWNPVLYLPAALFVSWVVIMTFKTLATVGSPVLAGIGAMSYLAPIPGLLLGYRFARDRRDIERFVAFYLIVNVAFCASLYLEKAGFDWEVLGSVGEGFVFYPESGGVSILYSGFFRSPELAGWHAMAGICLVLLLGLTRKHSGGFFVMATGVIAVLLPALIITGRRKFLAGIVIFLAFSGFLMGYYRFGLQRFAYALIAVALAAGGFYYYITASELPGEWLVYFERSRTTSEDSLERFQLMTWGMLEWVVKRNGFFGSGAGTGSQGAQHFGGGSVLVGAAAEGGLGKVLAELGVPGMALLVWVGVAGMLYIFSVCGGVRKDPRVAPLVYCFVGFLGANIIIFTTAHQIFGDVFILIILGLILGFVMRAPYLTGSAIPLAPVAAAGPVRRRIGRRFARREEFAG